MRYLLLGAGLQGQAIAYDLLHAAEGTSRLIVADQDQAAITRLQHRLGNDSRLETAVLDIRDEAKLSPLMAGNNVVISAVNYWFNEDLTRQAVAAGAHFLDLGGNNDVVERQFSLDGAARASDVAIVPDCGLVPGMAGILAHHLHGEFDEVERLQIRVGGLPQHPRPPLNYLLVFAAQGLINEYIEPCLVIRDGEITTVSGLSELETLTFPAPYGELEAFQTSGGVSTLPRSLAGKVRNLDYKTIRYRGHNEKIRLLRDLGLTASEPIQVNGTSVAPRAVLGAVLEKTLDHDDSDVVLVLVRADGIIAGQPVQRSIRIIDSYDSDLQLSAMQRMTGFPAAIIAHFLASGIITARGTLCQELVVPPTRFIAELQRRGVELERFANGVESA
ncbi:MAG: saccharopine dehydrogenase C-terminal domain-containing protein [bacterium]